MSPRKQKELDFRRKHIIQTARTVFSENGFTRTTIEQIATRAEIARATLYKLFPTKEEIYLGVVEDVFAEIYSLAGDIMKQDMPLRQKLEDYVNRLLQLFSEHAGFFKILIHQVHQMNIGSRGRNRISRIHDGLNEIITDDIRIGIKKRYVLIFNCMTGHIEIWFFEIDTG